MSTTTSIFGNNLEAPCAECGGHPLLAAHDANGGKFSHKYAPAPPEQPARESDEWHTERVSNLETVIRNQHGTKIGSFVEQKHAEQAVTNHARAALVPGLVEALKQCKTELECSMMTDGRDAAIRASGGALAAARKAGVE